MPDDAVPITRGSKHAYARMLRTMARYKDRRKRNKAERMNRKAGRK